MEEVRSSIREATTSFGTAVERVSGSRGRAAEEQEETRVGGRGGGGGGGGGDESPRRGKLLFGVANVGGSLTMLLQIALVAWGVRRLRSMLDNRRQRLEKERAEAASRRDSQEESAMRQASESEALAKSRPVDQVAFALLSPVAVKRLVELDPVRYVFVDVRVPDAVKDSPAPFEAVLNIPESELSASLQLSEAEWEGRYPSARKVGLSELIVFLSTKGHRAQRAANAAAGLGYSGCCILSGGIEAYVAAMSTYVDVPLKFLSRSQVPGIQNLTVISYIVYDCKSKWSCAIRRKLARGVLSLMPKDAVATIMEKHRQREEIAESESSPIHLLDVRRHDERTNFGHIRGSKHIPVTEFPKALTLDEDAWEISYHFPRIAEADTVIFQCRTNGRASWAAQLAQDAGFKRCFVYKDGILGWRLDPTVQPYNSYKVGDSPPDPIKFEVETLDHEAAKEELLKLGLG